MVGIKRKSGKYPWNATEKEIRMVDILNIGRTNRRILEAFEYGLSVDDLAEQNDILKKASEDWLKLNEEVTQLKEEEQMKSGDILYFWAEETALMVVMANDKGVRLYDVNNPEFTDEGAIITRFATYAELDEVCSFMGTIESMVRSKVILHQAEDTWS